jgi:DNA-binding Lrp family transcriptional regulator
LGVAVGLKLASRSEVSSTVARAYVLVEMTAGYSRSLVNSLSGRDGVRDASRVTGPFDVIVTFEGTDIEEISDFVTDQIHSLEGVVRTTTCVSLS